MGNSEVGHLNIGAGRVVYQDYTRIDARDRKRRILRAIRSCCRRVEHGARQPARRCTCWASCRRAACTAMRRRSLQWSSWRRARALSDVARACVPRRPRHAAAQRARFARVPATTSARSWAAARIASIVGRYYAMDRDQRWERVQAAYDLIIAGQRRIRGAGSRIAALDAAYARGENDEFVKADRDRAAGGGATRMDDGDVVRVHEFPRRPRAPDDARADRSPHSPASSAHACRSSRFFCTLTSYGEDFAMPAAFAPQSIANGFGEYIARQGLHQLRIAETEKYAHVTYFFNGGVETPYPGEERVLVPSPKVATYDLKPEMSAFEVTDKLVAAIQSAQIPRDRVQLRERRHGRPHRQPRGGHPRHRSARRMPRPRHQGDAGHRRRSADHRRPWQCRDDARQRRPTRRTPRTR